LGELAEPVKPGLAGDDVVTALLAQDDFVKNREAVLSPEAGAGFREIVAVELVWRQRLRERPRAAQRRVGRRYLDKSLPPGVQVIGRVN
jgi:hypothetical protein